MSIDILYLALTPNHSVLFLICICVVPDSRGTIITQVEKVSLTRRTCRRLEEILRRSVQDEADIIRMYQIHKGVITYVERH